jgi:hypothetical protein
VELTAFVTSYLNCEVSHSTVSNSTSTDPMIMILTMKDQSKIPYYISINGYGRTSYL